jgi:hypothetical protein
MTDAGPVANLPPGSLIPVANQIIFEYLLPVPTTPVENNGNNIDCLHLKVNMEEKIYLYVNYLKVSLKNQRYWYYQGLGRR